MYVYPMKSEISQHNNSTRLARHVLIETSDACHEFQMTTNQSGPFALIVYSTIYRQQVKNDATKRPDDHRRDKK